MRRFVLRHAKLQEGLTWFHLVYCNDEGYSPAQLEVIDALARVLMSAAVLEGLELGLEVEQVERDEARQDKGRLVMESAWTSVPPETASMDELRQLASFVVAKFRGLLAFLDQRSELFESCPDYQIRGLEIPPPAKSWVVVAEDKRTGWPLWEYCTDHADAKERRALMKAHAYRFSKFEILDPRALKDLSASLFASSTSPANPWPFPPDPSAPSAACE
ncbi:hypothetical protein [Variovorax sp. Varisp62]|uniref:hypothetical protein n=1 Tax=Variovorax sp. Varisp62 TaxID=3243049 RepID=UPI0039B4740F